MTALTFTVERAPGATAPPDALAQAFMGAGFTASAAGALTVRWAGGVEAVALSEQATGACLMAGDAEPADHGDRARAAGAMGYLTPATAQVVAALAAAALEREARGHAHRELVRLARPPAEDASDVSALALLVDRVASALEADGVRAGLRDDGQTQLVKRGPAPSWLTALPGRTHRVVVPDARLSPLCPAGATGAAVTVAVAGGGEGPELQVALSWAAPRLLSPAELAVLDLLPLQAGPTLAPRRAATAARAELAVTRRLVAEVDAEGSPRVAARQILAVLADRAGVPAALFLAKDGGPPARVHLLAAWARRPVMQAALSDGLAGLCHPAEPGDVPWRPIEADVQVQGLAVQRVLGLGDDATGWIVLLDRPTAREPRGISPALCEFAAALFEQRLAVGPDLADEAAPEDPEPSDVLVRAAAHLRELTEACQAVVYLPDGAGLTARYALPGRRTLSLRHPVAEASLTAAALADGAPRRVLQVGDPTDPLTRQLAHAHLQALTEAVELGPPRSWLVVPVVDDAERRVGAIKLLTGARGPFLTAADARLADAVAQRAALAMSRVSRRARLDALNRIGELIAARDGQALADSMVARLRGWFRRYAPPGGEIFLAVRSTIPVTGETVMVARASTGSVDEVALKALVDRSQAACEAPGWAEAPMEGRVGMQHYVGVPIHLPGDDGLQGHLYLLRAAPSDRVAARALVEAGREMSIILHHERFRVAWKLVIGRFRHALLGPVQGLQSAALALADEAAQPDADPAALEHFAEQIRDEGAAIHRWREYERLFDEARPRVRLRRQALRPVVERCAQRFHPRFADRQASLTVEWQVAGPLYMRFDDTALDLVVSNLLDNAAKYVFGHRHAWLRVYGTKAGVRLEVGDIGHRVDESTDIYRTGERLTWEDPFRVIAGQGIGLPLAKALVEAHAGALSHRCDPAGGSDKTDPATRPYRVVFTVDLPRDVPRTKEGS